MSKQLSIKQKQSIQLALDGLSWTDIASVLKISRQTLQEWRQLKEWQNEFERLQDVLYSDIAIFKGEFLTKAYRSLAEIGFNESVAPKDRIVALKHFIDSVHSAHDILVDLKYNKQALEQEIGEDNDTSI